MAPLLTLFLVALVGLPLAQTLDCHVCAYNGDNCFNPIRCPDMVAYCMTTRTYYTPTRMKVSKSCVPSCFETVYDGYSKHASTTSCCHCHPSHVVPPVQGLRRVLPCIQMSRRLYPLRFYCYPGSHQLQGPASGHQEVPLWLP
ncbi:ly-6/neurotoxin-like protein 1 isoform X1 [Carlito syrichta]|uniref:Ly-6/neurotoxin-like protein 1 isoform X1 n=1 Tax=Carlito syrichta TaxID=1868482 RepID=A0A1U7TWY9_CARSF|nr:ly-6/neurotoxin-like protein 1 isoform X1 [Carlito syrichta]XP_021572394.1 ly-6/neurotoxin-like protein 1 isoform X1 [Carlito syrichta]